MTITTLASGSGGNCVLLSGGGTHVLVDAGISARRIAAALSDYGLTPDDLSGVCVTHAHGDHTLGLATLASRFALPLYATAETAAQLYAKLPVGHCVWEITPHEPFALCGFTVSAAATSHDCAGSVGYRFTTDDGSSAAVVTDLGVVTDEIRELVRGVDALVVETNHDLKLLAGGRYPPFLQSRISGPKGHLCNEDGATLAAYAAQCGARHLILAHLSSENNTPRLAKTAVLAALDALGAAQNDVSVTVAPRSEAGSLCEV